MGANIVFVDQVVAVIVEAVAFFGGPGIAGRIIGGAIKTEAGWTNSVSVFVRVQSFSDASVWDGKKLLGIINPTFRLELETLELVGVAMVYKLGIKI